MQADQHGHYETVITGGEKVEAFIPPPLRPRPTIEWTPTLVDKFDEADYAIECLNATSAHCRAKALLPYVLVRKEAVFSSSIEGIFAWMRDLVRVEGNIDPANQWNRVDPVMKLVRAFEHGLRRLDEGFPLSLRLLRETHSVLFSGERGKHLTPGDFRRSQVWIGGKRPGDAAFVPPPADHVLDGMGDLELFLHDEPESGREDSPLFRAAVAHLQFETIHPFLDGNGRIGRLLIALILHDAKVLRQPLLCLSLYICVRTQRYYRLLNSVRETGDWTLWLEFFADAAIYAAEWALKAATHANVLVERTRERIQSMDEGAQSAQTVHDALLEQPLAQVPWLVAKTDFSERTVRRALDRLVQLKLVEEISDLSHDRVFAAGELGEIMNEHDDLREAEESAKAAEGEES